MSQNKLQRHDLAVQIYDWVHEHTESFEEDNIGSDLAYLMGAILKESAFEAEDGCPLVELLKSGFPSEHALWTYIDQNCGTIPPTERNV